MLTPSQIEAITGLRIQLHACPERSGQEVQTLQTIRRFLAENTTLAVEDMGGWLLATHWEGDDLPTLGFRADMDAIPVEGTACARHGADARHGCGHDGHSAILCGLGLMLEGRRVGKNVRLIFQAAEETGEGARHICETWPELASLSRLYALHNIPGFPKGAVLMRRGCFACASCGLVVRIQGRPAHAAYPGDGANPIELLSRLALETPDMIRDILGGDGRLLMRTLIGLIAGGENFGLSASEGRLNQTLRGHRKADIDALIAAIRARAEAGCAKAGMTYAFELRDVFPDTTNDDGAFDDALERFGRAGLNVVQLAEPMRWSEDFGWYLKRVPGLYFGIGAGEDWPGLHTDGFHFDDTLIPTALRALEALL
ncbi:MAG: amidohydrolase [Clostridia bacterium]|nr:amidohydrolase [Clostridia bacterium]